MNDEPKEIDLGNGLRLTESYDMGMFLHFESLSGHQCGVFLGNTEDTMGHKWAAELLATVDSEARHKEKG